MQRAYQRLITACLLISSFIFLCGVDSCNPPDCTSVDRFLDNNDGTIADCRTDLVWLKDANCYDTQNWNDTTDLTAGLSHGECGLSDRSSAGDWKLPTKEELQTIGTDPQSAWVKPGEPFVNVQGYFYWSSTEINTSSVWYLVMNNGNTNSISKDGYNFCVWPVRSDN